MLPGETRHLLSSDPLRMSAESGLVRTRLSLRASIVTVIAGSVGLIVLGGRVLETRFYRAAMPPEIELAFDLATTASGMSLLEAATPLRHEDCGGAIFGLSNRMAASLRDRGALADARQGRGYTDTADPLFFHYSYEPWQPTPLPPEWTSEGMWSGLFCMNLDAGFGRSIVEAARTVGSFCATHRDAMLLIVPSLKIAVYTHKS
jgi:hypothetical protein